MKALRHHCSETLASKLLLRYSFTRGNDVLRCWYGRIEIYPRTAPSISRLLRPGYERRNFTLGRGRAIG